MTDKTTQQTAEKIKNWKNPNPGMPSVYRGLTRMPRFGLLIAATALAGFGAYEFHKNQKKDRMKLHAQARDKHVPISQLTIDHKDAPQMSIPGNQNDYKSTLVSPVDKQPFAQQQDSQVNRRKTWLTFTNERPPDHVHDTPYNKNQATPSALAYSQLKANATSSDADRHHPEHARTTLKPEQQKSSMMLDRQAHHRTPDTNDNIPSKTARDMRRQTSNNDNSV